MRLLTTWLLSVSMIVIAGFGTLSQSAAGADDKKSETREVKIDDIALIVPSHWKEQEPSSRLRKAQFEIPQVEGDSDPAELVVSFFEGSGGGIDANVQRWVNQFQSKERTAKLTEGTSKQGKYAFAEIAGTYNKPVGPPIRQQTKPMPGARMLGVILTVEGKGNYFLKLTGPEKTVAAAADAFRASFGADAKSEKELKSAGE